MRPFLFLVAFGAAIWAMGAGWAALLDAWATPTGREIAAVAGYVGVFLGALLYVGFGVYAADRAAGRVRRRIGLYERILARRGRGHGAGSGARDVMMRRTGE